MTMADFSPFRLRNPNMTLKERFLHLSWCYIFLIFLVAFSGFVVLYAAANGNWEPWVFPFLAGLCGDVCRCHD